MKPLLAVVPFTGSEKLVAMTAAMLAAVRPCLPPDTTLLAVANKPSRLLTFEELATADANQLTLETNTGFGPGINAALEDWSGDVLALNNDLEFPQQNWLEVMRTQQAADERDGFEHFVYAPRTTITATWQACAEGPEDKPAQRLDQISAYAWLVPAKVRARLRERAGFEMFPPEFPVYGSDDAAAAWLRRLFGRTPFQLVHRAFVRHLKGRTSAETGDKPGDKDTLKRLRAYLRANKLTWHV